MDINDVIKNIYDILVEKCGINIELDNINEETSFMDIGLSSINYIKILIQLEELYDIEFDDIYFSINSINRVGTIANFIMKKLLQSN